MLVDQNAKRPKPFIKPILRWTIGDLLQKRGFAILAFSVENMIELYKGQFDYYVCSNCKNTYNRAFLQRLCDKFHISFLQQSWKTCPLPLSESAHAKTSIWKICPPRLSMDVHEIILDNDVVFYSKPEEIDIFLNSNKTLVTQDTLQYFDQFSNMFENDVAYNSGIMGLPPKYDFRLEIRKYWRNHKLSKKFEEMPHRQLTYGDEQGLLTYALLQHPHIIANSDRFAGIHHGNISELVFNKTHSNKKTPRKHTYTQELIAKLKECPVIHFLEANRENYHYGWTALQPPKKIYL